MTIATRIYIIPIFLWSTLVNHSLHNHFHLRRAGFDAWVEKVKQSPDTLNTTAAFNELAKPSQKNPVTYYSSVKPMLFQETISKFGHTGRGIKNEFMTESEVILKLTGTLVGKASSLTVAIPCSG